MKKSKYMFEVFLGSSHIDKSKWNELLLLISNYLGYFNKWKLIIDINMSEIRYFILSSKELSTTIGDINEFIFKPINENIELNVNQGLFCNLPMNANLIDIYTDNEVKNQKLIRRIEFDIKLSNLDKYSSNTSVIFENKTSKSLTIKRAMFCEPSSILDIDYKDSRFFYKKKPKYLDIQKVLHLLKSDSINSILKVDTFPYLQGDYYLNQNQYSFDKHSLIIGWLS